MKAARQRRGRPTTEGHAERKLRSAQRTQRTAIRHESLKSDWFDTGTFGATRPPKVVGVSVEVGIANRKMASAARRAERAWRRSLKAS